MFLWCAHIAQPNCWQDSQMIYFSYSQDVDKNGKINWTEFLAATIEVHGDIEEHKLAETFDRIDADNTVSSLTKL